MLRVDRNEAGNYSTGGMTDRSVRRHSPCFFYDRKAFETYSSVIETKS